MSLSLPTPPRFMTLPPRSAAAEGATRQPSLLGGLILAAGIGALVGAAVLLLAAPAQAASAQVQAPPVKPGQPAPAGQQPPMTFPSLQAPPPTANPWFDGQWTAGAGAGVSTTLYKGDDDKISPLPIVSFDSERLHIGTDGLAVTALTLGEAFSISALAGYQDKPFKQKDSPMLRGLHTRKAAIEGGVSAEYATSLGAISLTYKTALNGAYHGGSVDLSYDWQMERDRWRLGAGAGLLWQSADLVDYYVGVRKDEARTDRRAYDPKAAILPHVSLSAGYALNPGKTWWLNAGLEVTQLPKEYTDSPIVDADAIIGGMLGITYTF
ncbi:MipA/OmpV family protein [Novispirillum itersonii]|uniref:Outer membrane protein n=1 Tax=Novispirillum itersonii TaxID=189 RepID=A0A7W9ZHH4_NOVIT|nr:MipA/OmpV family protein [Novispirillum itersonii]MBB6211571.1 outer membrane protein [Novispirillum itersonii]